MFPYQKFEGDYLIMDIFNFACYASKVGIGDLQEIK